MLLPVVPPIRYRCNGYSQYADLVLDLYLHLEMNNKTCSAAASQAVVGKYSHFRSGSIDPKTRCPKKRINWLGMLGIGDGAVAESDSDISPSMTAGLPRRKTSAVSMRGGRSWMTSKKLPFALFLDSLHLLREVPADRRRFAARRSNRPRPCPGPRRRAFPSPRLPDPVGPIAPPHAFLGRPVRSAISPGLASIAFMV